MQFNVIIEVAIGMVVLFWIVATTASFVVEAITSFVNLRGRALEMFVREMLVAAGTAHTLRQTLKWFPRTAREERPVATPTTGSVGLDELDVTDHPLVRRLAKPSGLIRSGDTSPSYIPADLFTKALLDRLRQIFGGLLVAADAVRAVRAALPVALQLQTEVPLHLALSRLDAATALSDLLTALATQANRSQVLDAVRSQLPEGPAKLALGILATRLATPADWLALQQNPQVFIQSAWPDIAQVLGSRTPTVADLQAIVASGHLPPSLSFALRPLLDAANHDMETFRKALEGWYDSVMDRATGWFRRYAQAMLLVASFVIVAWLNLDAFQIGKRLMADPDARAVAVRVAETVVQEGVDATSLVQVYGFEAAYRDGRWATALTVGQSNDSNDRLKAADDLAIRVQPRLLKSGALIGPMLALQAAVLRTEGRCIGKSDGECDQAKAIARWKEMTDLQDPLLAALCRASLVRAEDVAWADSLSDAALVAAIGDAAKAAGRCQTQLTLVRAKDEGALRALDGLWASGLVVWNPALGAAAWEVRQLTHASRGASAAVAPLTAGSAPAAAGSAAAATNSSTASSSKGGAAVGAFAIAMGNAVADARKRVQSADDLLSRLPHVGPGGVWDYWKAKAAAATATASTSLEPRLPGTLGGTEVSVVGPDGSWGRWKAGNAASSPVAASGVTAALAPSGSAGVTDVLGRAGLGVILGSFAGWLFTAFMASLGAPMWFDLLNKLVNRRISGPKPEPGVTATP